MADMDASLLADMLRQSLQQGQQPQLTVTSNSMAPLLRRGDQIILEAVTLAELTAGDIVTLAAPGTLITHRFWQMKGESLLTRGDRPLSFDAPWPTAALIGRVTARIRGQRRLRLDEGAGQRLNQRLCHLAAWEFRRWGRDAAPELAVKRFWWERGRRGLLYGWALLWASWADWGK